ncbi:KxYKxGKxW signal peptide domain-containing protein [Lacticaseibacillus casei]|uniref:KxYKxGKxW signal peptide domain-containing protein n=1 Tax=Lacticaseibacillus casei TaxID=1582 RepID=UPI000665BE50|nr:MULTISPECIES: KxYKxGKxW signal peptide domain-containing protein [Lacticaseibacillus]WFB43044.1 KxYKxGKxW signal peptide domain-containing protein [Lacticaseibacillus huelsenbergensis]
MSRLNPQRQKRLFETNSKSRFRMYKAGKQWLVAGIATLSGLFGMGAVASSPVHASTSNTAGVGKEAGKQDVLATQNQATIPASSNTTSQSTSESTSTSASESVSASQSVSASDSKSTSDSTKNSQSTSTSSSISAASASVSESISKSESAAKSGSTTESQSNKTTQSESQKKSESTSNQPASKETSVSVSESTSTSTNPSKQASTSSSESTTGKQSTSTSESQSLSTSQSTSLSISEQSLSDLAAKTGELATTDINKLTAMMAQAKTAAADSEFTITDQKDFKSGESAAESDLKSIIKNIDLKGFGVAFNIGNVKAAVNQLAALIDDYIKNPTLYTNTTITDSKTGTNAYDPIWKPDNRNGSDWPAADNWLDLSTYGHGYKVNSSLPSFNAGYVTYLRSYAKGILDDLTAVKNQSTNPDAANSLINNTTYRSGDLSGSSLGGVIANGLSFIWNSFWNNYNVPKVLQVYTDSSVAASNVNTTVGYLNNLVGLVAPYIINGIAHQALSDIRSIGNAKMGADGKIDYAPDKFTDAVALNGNIKSFLGLVGLDGVISSTLMQRIYDSIKTVAQQAIMNNWATGEYKALQNLMNNGIYDDGSNTYKATGYDVNNPAAVTNSNQANLSDTTQAAAYAWAMKVFTPLLQKAASDAWSGSPADNIDELIDSLSVSDADKALLKTDNAQNTASGLKNYARSAEGAREMIQQIYSKEYQAVAKALYDFRTDPTYTDAQLAQRQKDADLNFEPVGDPALNGGGGTATTLEANDYTRTYQFLRDAMYQGQANADIKSHSQKDGKVDPLKPDPTEFTAQKSILSSTLTPLVDDLTNFARPYYSYAYQVEAIRANNAFAAGLAKAHEEIAANPAMPVPDAGDAGKITVDGQDYSAKDDTTASIYTTVASAVNKNAPAAGQAFTDGYQSILTEVTVTLQAKSGETGFPDAKTYTVWAPTDQLTNIGAPTVKGWIPEPVNAANTFTGKTGQITFTYHKGASIDNISITNPTDSRQYNGELLNYPDIDPTITITWNDGTTTTTQSLKFSSISGFAGDMHEYFNFAYTSDEGKWTIQLNQNGADAVLSWIKNQLKYDGTSFEVPDSALDLLPQQFTYSITKQVAVTSKKNVNYIIGNDLPTAKDLYDYVVVNGVKYDASQVKWNADGSKGTIDGVGTITLNWNKTKDDLQTAGTYTDAADLQLTLQDGTVAKDAVNVISSSAKHDVTVNNNRTIVYVIGGDKPTAKEAMNGSGAYIEVDGTKYTTDDIKWSSDGNTGTITTKDGKTITVTLEWSKGAEDAIETAGLHSNAANVEVTLSDKYTAAGALNVYSTTNASTDAQVDSKKNIGYTIGHDLPTAKDAFDAVVVNGVVYTADQVTWNNDGTGTIDGVGTFTIDWSDDAQKTLQTEGMHKNAGTLVFTRQSDKKQFTDSFNVYSAPDYSKQSTSASESTSMSDSERTSTSASASTSTSTSASLSASESATESNSISQSTSKIQSESVSASDSKRQSESAQSSQSTSESTSVSMSESSRADTSNSASTSTSLSASTSAKESTTKSTSKDVSESDSASHSTSMSTSTSSSESSRASQSESASLSGSVSASESASTSDKDSTSASTSESQYESTSSIASGSDRKSASTSASVSTSASASGSTSESDVKSESNSASESLSASESDSRNGNNSGASISQSASTSASTSVSVSTSESTRSSESVSKSDSQRDATSKSADNSKTASESGSVSASTSASKSLSERRDESKSASTSTSLSASTSTRESNSASASISDSTSKSVRIGINLR